MVNNNKINDDQKRRIRPTLDIPLSQITKSLLIHTKSQRRSNSYRNSIANHQKRTQQPDYF